MTTSEALTGQRRKLIVKALRTLSELIPSPVDQMWARSVLEGMVLADLANSIVKFAGAVDVSVIAGERDFEFKGEEVKCELAEAGIPHAPHVVGSYQTVRYGALDYYCMGKEGSMVIWGHTITIKLLEVKRWGWRVSGRVRVEVTA
jgi:hypothetical protein